jgi:hypothetical protein
MVFSNPVCRGLVSTAEEWQWSSARWHAGQRPVQMEMDKGVLVELARDGVGSVTAMHTELGVVSP